MKKLYALIVPLCLVLGACTTADEPGADQPSVPISFSQQVEAATKATGELTAGGANGTTKLTKFWVFGLYRPDGSKDEYSYVFENMEVSDTDGNKVWDTATPGYWIPGQTYRFAAYSDGNCSLPTGSSSDSHGVNDNNGTFRINGYEAGNRDLVVAKESGISSDDVIAAILGTDPEHTDKYVNLTFQHILSMLTFTFENETTLPIEVTDIRFAVYNSANYRNDNWDSFGENLEERTLHSDSSLTVDAASSTAASSAVSDTTFVIPQSNAKVTVTFTVNIRNSYENGGSLVYSKRYTASLATGEQTVVFVDEKGEVQEINITNQWYIGYRYNYTATIPADVMQGANVTLTVSVKDWDKQDTTVSWGGQDEDSDDTTTNP